MDMALFRHKKTFGRSPDLSVLLAREAARQAVSPTARTAAQSNGGEKIAAAIPEIEPFLARRPGISKGSASFNKAVAAALLTSGQLV
jgi:hypothetical protein